LKKKLSGQCICGYFFGTFDNVKEAIVKVKLHFKSYHEDFLPFGITDAEALALLKKGMSHGKKLVCSNNSRHFNENRRIVQQITN
jgi:hypothetical protein